MAGVVAGIAVLAAVAGLGATAEARPRCRGTAFARSCVRPLYRCFDGAGTCTRDLSALFTAGAVTDCWANGTTARLDGLGQASGTSRLTNRKGKTCLSGTTEWGPNFDVTIHYRRGRRSWTIRRTVDGAYTVTCPSGAVETYAPADVTAGGCGPIADCAAGSCE